MSIMSHHQIQSVKNSIDIKEVIESAKESRASDVGNISNSYD